MLLHLLAQWLHLIQLYDIDVLLFVKLHEDAPFRRIYCSRVLWDMRHFGAYPIVRFYKDLKFTYFSFYILFRHVRARCLPIVEKKSRMKKRPFGRSFDCVKTNITIQEWSA